MKQLIIFVIFISFTFCLIEPLLNTGRLECGIDMQIGDSNSDKAIKYPIFDFYTYHNHKTLYIDSNHTFLVPDQLFEINDPSIQETSIVEIFTSQFTLQESMSLSSSYGYKSWFTNGMFSSSSQATTFNEMYQKEASYMAISYLRVTNYKISFNDKLNLTTEFKTMFEDLPNIFNKTTCPTYKKFFNIYGTNYLSSAIMGGYFKMTTRFAMSLFEELSITEIKTDISTQFLLLTTQTTLTEEQEEELQQLNLVYTSTFELVGGDPSKYNITSYQAWASSVIDNPLVTNMEIHNYTTFLDHNETHRINALNLATKSYFYEPYINWQNISIAPYISNTGLITPVMIDYRIYFPLASEYSGYYYNIKTNIWHDMLPIPNNAAEEYTSACSALGSNIYCFGFSYSSRSQISAVYNTELETWNILPAYKNWIIDGRALTIGDNIYIFGSEKDDEAIVHYLYSEPNPIIIFNTQTNTYSEIPVPVYNYANPESDFYTCIIGYQVINIEDEVYMFGGMHCIWRYIDNNDNNFSKQVYKYNVSNNTWISLEDMPTYLVEFSLVQSNDVILLIGGMIVTENKPGKPIYTPNTVIYAFDYVNNFWTSVDKYSYNTAGGGCAALYDDLLFFITLDYNSVYNNVWVKSLLDFC